MINSIEISMISPLFVELFHNFFTCENYFIKNQNFNLKLET